MRENLIEMLQCLECGQSRWKLDTRSENEREFREGTLQCLACQKTYGLAEGIMDFVGKLPQEVEREKKHAESFGYIVTSDGERHTINRETIHRFRKLFLSLPAGDGGHFFKPGGSFDNQAGNAERFFRTLRLLKLSGQERVLEVGAGFGWGAWRFAQRGCEVVALDVTNYLIAADLYMEEDECYFDRVMANMSQLPFKENSFDVILSHSVIHHCKDLQILFSEFRRVLKPGGRVVALHECAYGIFEDKSGASLQEAIEDGFNENAYTIPEWKKGARKGGFSKIRFHFFSPVDDYVHRKRLRESPVTFKLKIAYWIRSKSFLNQFLTFLSIMPRILFRPKAWMMIATKK